MTHTLHYNMLRALLVFSLALTLSRFTSSFVFRPTNTISPDTRLKMSSEAAPTLIDPKETALVLIEYQNEFTTEGESLL